MRRVSHEAVLGVPRAVQQREDRLGLGMDGRGAWIERGKLRYHKIEPESGIIDCRTFAENVKTLCLYLNSHK